MTDEQKPETQAKHDEARKSRFEILIEMGNALSQILAIDRSNPGVARSIDMAVTKRDEMLMWAQTAFHMFDKHLAAEEAKAQELAKKEAEKLNADSANSEQSDASGNTETPMP